MFAVDPGETSGWAWGCVGRNEALSDPATGGLRLAQRHRSGTLAADRRVMHGEITGRVYDVVSKRFLPFWESEAHQAEQILDMMVVMQNMGRRSSLGAVPEISTLVVEDFILRERTKDRSLLSPVRVTSALLTLLPRYPELKCSVHLQSASDAKSTVTDERLQRWGFWVEGSTHVRDALRHLLMYVREVNGGT